MRTESFGSVRIFWPLYSRDELIERLRAGAAMLHRSLPLKRAALFGSWASGRATAFSDVDILVVYEGAPRVAAYAEAVAAFQVPRVELHVYSEAEAAGLDPTLAAMTKDGVDLL